MEIKIKINNSNSLINAWIISNDKEISFESLPINDKVNYDNRTTF